jgi:hypothetical protein
VRCRAERPRPGAGLGRSSPPRDPPVGQSRLSRIVQREREREREAKHHGAYGVDISVDTPWWRTSSSSARPGLLPASWEGLGFHLVAGSGPAGRAHGQGNKGQWKSRNGGAGQTGGRETRNHAHGSPRGADATKCRARHLGEGRTTSALERTHITLTS